MNKAWKDNNTLLRESVDNPIYKVKEFYMEVGNGKVIHLESKLPKNEFNDLKEASKVFIDAVMESFAETLCNRSNIEICNDRLYLGPKAKREEITLKRPLKYNGKTILEAVTKSRSRYWGNPYGYWKCILDIE